MTLHDVRRQFAHWKRYPPLRDLLVSTGFTAKPEAFKEKRKMTLEEFRAQFPQGINAAG